VTDPPRIADSSAASNEIAELAGEPGTQEHIRCSALPPAAKTCEGLRRRPSGRQGLRPDGPSTACCFQPRAASVCGGLGGSRVSDGEPPGSIMPLVEPDEAKASHLDVIRPDRH